MKKTILFLCLFPLLTAADLPDWGRTGHRAIGEVAEAHLSRRARKAVSRLLEGESLAKVSTFGDDIKSDTTYRSFSPWHYVNLPPETPYGEITPNPDGDILQGIEHCIRVLKDPASPRDQQVFYLKLLVHLVGDLHQPMHVGRPEDRGGNDIQLQYFDKGTNLHRLWDSDMIEDYGMSYTELAETLPPATRREIRVIQSGSVLEWAGQSQSLANRVYASVENGEKLYYRYRYLWWDSVERQLLLGGLRLAAVLNDIYG
ncbi:MULTISPECIES: S1/P1 nuclease [Robiginitalea]|uniref:Putative S1/P1 Nuclease n=1 Tax=Robiginitalea biformata (strain ATCC BAA-864 / DSM 15991 / KCTC 12146 / HTCC2501) TaxID=313596 RepID=A4CQ68_ROBBH|nr:MULTISPECIES: S1/P1 nuclease [Robiginitalea]EAR14153.1 putative S1/P1 Nuclease [Robiginitalea biformata HTCC2501]MDC6354752.1 S1/P1 nuclease [Robiginitalea sp. PM2]MDC6375018.1 S1/P1 nuclease [Robiginitalea sp. SP8]